MSAECLAAIHLCRIRVTRLTASGAPAPGPNNVYVSDKGISLGLTPVITAGADRELIGGCDQILASWKGDDKLKRWDLQLDVGKLEPALVEMLTGSPAISSAGDVIGNWWTEQQFAGAGPLVAFEGWMDAIEDDHPHAVFPFWHWVWPATKWQFGPQTLQNDFLQPRLNGFSRGNTLWGDGIFGDYPEAAEPLGGYFLTALLPAAECGYQSRAIT